MTTAGWLQNALFLALVAAITKPLGRCLHRIFEGAPLLPRVERVIYRLTGVDASKEQTWWQYTAAMLAFSAMGLVTTYAIQRMQHVLPLNPQGFPAVEPALAFNTAVSFTTNTNWQAYAGESTMGHLTQMAGLAWHNFTSAAVGLGVALALARGLTRKNNSPTLGNFWVDLTRGLLYVLLPVCIPIALFFVSQGVVQTLDGQVPLTTLEGAAQTLALGPVASQEAIKQLGTNGGGFFNANSAHPFENPNAVTNLLQLLLVFAIPAALTHTYGRMAGDTRQGWAIFGAMAALFVVGLVLAYAAESHGTMEGKETRFGIAGSVLFAVVTTAASCGAVNAMHDSFTALGGLVPMVNIQLGEVVFGGVGAGLYGMLIFVLLTVFIAGLMVGRTPEYLGKKVEAHELKLSMIYVLVFPLLVLGLTGWSAVAPYGVSSLNNAGPHGLSELMYAATSATGNNGSAFAGLNANTPFWNLSLAAAMLLGRFGMIVPVLAIAGSMAGKKTSAPGPGTFPTEGPLFAFLLVAIIVIVGALTFFPALSLGPIAEHFAAAAGREF